MGIGSALASAGASALAGGLLGGRGGGGKLHGWQERAGKRYQQAAGDVYDLPFTPYQGMPFAGPNATLNAAFGYGVPLAQRGFGMARDVPGRFNRMFQRTADIRPNRNAFFGQFFGNNNALSRFKALGVDVDPITGQQVTDQAQQFLNPYNQEVIDRFTEDADRARIRAQVNRGDQFASIGALGGSANQLADAATNQAFAREVGNMSAGLRKSGYDDAFQRAMGLLTGQQGVDMQQQMANQQASIAGAGVRGQAAQRAMGMAQFLPQFALNKNQALMNAALQGGRFGLDQIGQMMGMGQTQQGYLDRGPAFDYAQYMAGQEHPYRQLGVLGDAANAAMGVPSSRGGGSPWMSALAGGLGGFLQGAKNTKAANLPSWLQWMGSE